MSLLSFIIYLGGYKTLLLIVPGHLPSFPWAPGGISAPCYFCLLALIVPCSSPRKSQVYFLILVCAVEWITAPGSITPMHLK